MKPRKSDLDYAVEHIRLMGTRIASFGKSSPSYLDVPVFVKSHAASNYELFYDLWFVANLNVFASVHDITDGAALKSFIGYIVLLWTTWLMTTIYDVRFTSDSILERCCRAAHLGVMTGFALLGTSFNPENQVVAVYRAMSCFLAVSRLVLALQYGLSAWQVRTFAHGKGRLLFTAACHLAAAAVYFGISFRYEAGKNSRVYVVWYVLGVAEMALHLGCSQLSPVLTFVGSHFGERLNLLTLIVMGEGIIILAKNITLVVKDTYLKDPAIKVWSLPLVGLVASSAALIYIIFQLYFDWMYGEDEPMSRRHQVWWASLHLPFHVALILLLEGANQFISWRRMSESMCDALKELSGLDLRVHQTSKAVAGELGRRVMAWTEKYPPPDIVKAHQNVHAALDHIRALPDSFWNNRTDLPYTEPIKELFFTMVSGIFNAFGMEAPERKDIYAPTLGRDSHAVMSQTDMVKATSETFRLVFLYAFLCAGIVLLFLTIMHMISKNLRTPFNMFRSAICLALSIGLSLTTIVITNQDALGNFMSSPWMLPTITLSYFTALVITHLPHPRRFAYKEVEKQQQQQQDDRDNVPFKHVLPEIVVTRLNCDADPCEEDRREVLLSPEPGMATSPGYDATFDADPPGTPPLGGRPESLDDPVNDRR